MNTSLDCMACYVRQALDASRLATDDEKIQEAVLREILARTAAMDVSVSTVAMGQQIHRLVRRLTGMEDPYRELKDRFNLLALKLLPELRQIVQDSVRPLDTAVHLAIAGNIIDFGVKSKVDDEHLHHSIRMALEAPLSGDITDFEQKVDAAENILYLADNAGEIVFDRLLIEQLPMERVTLAVRGRPVINDVTRHDAEVAGLTELVKVIDNGDDAPGTILGNCSTEFREHFDAADLVIAKGQGNYESLMGVEGSSIIFVLRAKCSVIADDIGCELGSFVIKGNS
jgi:uncharacterized protein with ATP-grasp and redox domains